MRTFKNLTCSVRADSAGVDTGAFETCDSFSGSRSSLSACDIRFETGIPPVFSDSSSLFVIFGFFLSETEFGVLLWRKQEKSTI